MKKKDNKKVAIIALILLLCVAVIAGGSYAIYVSQATGTDTARVAKFAFDLNGANASTQVQSLDITDLFNYTYNNGTVVGNSNNKVVAPGTSGYVEINLQNQGEVAIIPSWVITETNAKNVPLEYQVSTSTTPTDSKWSDAGTLNPTENAIGINGSQTFYLHWRWSTASNAADTQLGIDGTATVSIKLDCTVSQHIG